MSIANEHNLHHDPVPAARPFGIRVQLRREDPFTLLVGKDWQKEHWFATAAERDAALSDMTRHHEYSRIGDDVTLTFEKVENLAARRAR